MKTFIKYITIVSVGVLCLDIAVRVLFYFVYTNVPQNANIRQHYKYEYYDSDAELLIIGASKAMFGYKPSIFSDSLNMRTFNAGMDGVGVVGNYLALKKAIEKGHIRVVIYDCGASQLTKEWNQDRISQFYPFYWLDTDVKEAVDDFIPNEKWKLYSALLQYNSCYFDIIRSFFDRVEHDQGFQALPYTGKDIFIPPVGKDEGFAPDSLCLVYLKKIVSLCKNNHIQLIFTVSPGFNITTSFSDFLSGFAQDNEVICWNFTDLEVFKNDLSLFRDYLHLNERGVEVYNPILANKLKSQLVGLCTY